MVSSSTTRAVDPSSSRPAEFTPAEVDAISAAFEAWLARMPKIDAAPLHQLLVLRIGEESLVWGRLAAGFVRSRKQQRAS